MGKHEFMTPKAIANRIKSKGLQKLRWFCQLCNKQCRDENGFKCHSESEGHQRQLSLFAGRPGKFLDAFSADFEKNFLDELRRRFGSKRVHANLVYNEYIRDKNHTHMNSTRWTTLTGFCMYLGKTGKCIVDETPKGWYIAYINKDRDAIARQEALAKKEKMDVDDEERTKRMIQKRLELLAQMEQEVPIDQEGEEGIENNEPSFDPEQPHEPVRFSLLRNMLKMEPQVKSEPGDENPTTTTSSSNGQQSIKSEPTDDDAVSASSSTTASAPSVPSSPATPSTPSVPTPSGQDSKYGIKLNAVNPFELAARSAKDKKAKETDKDSEKDSKDGDKKRKKSTLEQLKEEQERGKEKKNRKDFWITPGIVVKIMNKNLAGGKYYKEKGVVEDVIDRYVAQIRCLELGDVLKLDQSQLETVIPTIGGKMKVVNGAYRGDMAVLQSLDVDRFSANIKLTSGPAIGKVMAFPYEDVCKTHAQ